MSEGSGQPQRYCRNCGAEVRSGIQFCVSCGASLAPEPETSESAREDVTSAGEYEAKDESRQHHHDPSEQDGGSTQSIYAEYHLLKRFFQEARDGLIRFSDGLKQDEKKEELSDEGLTHNDLAGPLLHAQKGVNKAEEYRETLTAPMFRNESSQRKAQSMLVELREIQKDILASLETFWNKLEAEEGHTEFKDEFARWYVGSLEPHMHRDTAHGEGGTRTAQGEPQKARPSGSSADTHYGAGGLPINQLPNRIINWFRDLPSTPKLIIAGLVLLFVFTVLSPLAFVGAAVLLGVSVIILIYRMFERGSVKGWGIVAVASLVSLFVFGGISNAIYGNDFPKGTTNSPEKVTVPQGDKKQALIGTWRTSRNGNVDVFTLNPDGTVESQNPGAPVLVGTYRADVTKTPATLVMDFNPNNNRVDANLLVEFIDIDHLRVTMGSGASQSDTLTYTRIK